ncbi:MAG: hypothetical protein Unbinned3528contig1000_22 [Prokaryotic dsDNA virus sp.]|mgnify:FL=1|nr:MAG: hypothetical protein Unbinned3528contig1000_22 [Prokaryotic dsDNA virus sp.]|tara:strand:- start:6086 stop:6631 length:546 start_codon:yes stop_codon:yes gene_type:complete
MELNKLNDIMREFVRQVVVEARANVPFKKTSSRLKNSINGDYIPETQTAFFTMLEYGKYQDLGVKGTQSGESVGKKYYGSQAKEYKYTTKMPPPRALDSFVVRKGLAPRDSKGRFLPRAVNKVGFQKSLAFLIARSIFGKGIKPSLFFTKPFIKYYKDLPNKVAKAFGDDFEIDITKKLNP